MQNNVKSVADAQYQLQFLTNIQKGSYQERTSIINTQKDPLGKDRLGRKDNKANDNSDENTFYKTGTLALAEYRDWETDRKSVV